MEVILALPFLIIPLLLPVTAGLMAKSFGRKFWPWFLLALPLPFVAHFILLSLPERSAKQDMLN